MSGVEVERERVAGVMCHSLRDPMFIGMLRRYRQLLLGTYGPKSGTILVSNSAGAMTLAATSSEIVKQLPFFHPIVKYINALVTAQNGACNLNGIYTGLLCSRMLEEALLCEECPHQVIADVSEWIISRILGLLDQSPPEVSMELDISDIEQVISFVKTILASKSCLDITQAEMENISIHIVKAFLKSIPPEYSASGFGHVSVVCQEGSSVMHTKIFDGVLHRDPDISPIKIKKVAEAQKVINVLLFVTPISYIEGENESVQWLGGESRKDAFINHVLPCLTSCLTKRNIHILACQKTVEHEIKFELERRGHIVLERLGTNTTEALLKLTDCEAIGSLSNLSKKLNTAMLGEITSLEYITYNGKGFICMDHHDGCVSTLLLPGTNPSICSTLKETTESCLGALRMLVVDGKVVPGGGCLEAWLAAQVDSLVHDHLDLLVATVEATPHHIIKVASIFRQAFMELALVPAGGPYATRFDFAVDSVFHHLWHSLSRENNSLEATSSSKQCCVCGLVQQTVLKDKYGGTLLPAEFKVHHKLSDKCSRLNNGGKCQKGEGDSPRDVDSESVEVSEEGHTDSLEENAATAEEDEDSLERSVSIQEEEIDSLEGKLDSISLDEDADSLDDILDRVKEPTNSKIFVHSKVELQTQMADALLDSFPAKYNALRLALEGFTHLFNIGNCVFDK